MKSISLKKWIIKQIENYQHNSALHTTKKCRFSPTCSEYAKIAFARYNLFYASFLSIKRILKCNPLHKMAYDPVPLERKYRTKYKTLEDSLADLRLTKCEHKWEE